MHAALPALLATTYFVTCTEPRSAQLFIPSTHHHVTPIDLVVRPDKLDSFLTCPSGYGLCTAPDRCCPTQGYCCPRGSKSGHCLAFMLHYTGRFTVCYIRVLYHMHFCRVLSRLAVPMRQWLLPAVFFLLCWWDNESPLCEVYIMIKVYRWQLLLKWV